MTADPPITKNRLPTVGIVGSGPAALIAADVLASRGFAVIFFEKRVRAARKIYIAGKSGLNISYDASLEDLANYYSGPPSYWQQWLDGFSPTAWLSFINQDLGLKTFLGTSRRYFVDPMHATPMVRNWRLRLTKMGATWLFRHEAIGFERTKEGMIRLSFKEQRSYDVDAVVLALGGGSYEPDEDPLRWPQMFIKHQCLFHPFTPANVGFRVDWHKKFLEKCEGRPLKNIVLKSARGEKRGDCVVTSYGIEGTPVYFAGASGTCYLDLKPDLSVHDLSRKCLSGAENLSPMRRVQKKLSFDAALCELIFFHTPKNVSKDLSSLLHWIKHFPIEVIGPQPLAEAISSDGGIDLSEVTASLMLKRVPGVFVAGEMLDWSAPTGGFLIQGCVSQGHQCGISVCDYLAKDQSFAAKKP